MFSSHGSLNGCWSILYMSTYKPLIVNKAGIEGKSSTNKVPVVWEDVTLWLPVECVARLSFWSTPAVRLECRVTSHLLFRSLTLTSDNDMVNLQISWFTKLHSTLLICIILSVSAFTFLTHFPRTCSLKYFQWFLLKDCEHCAYSSCDNCDIIVLITVMWCNLTGLCWRVREEGGDKVTSGVMEFSVSPPVSQHSVSPPSSVSASSHSVTTYTDQLDDGLVTTQGKFSSVNK